MLLPVPQKKEKRTKKERKRPDGNRRNGGKTKNSFSTVACKTLRVLHRFHRPGDGEYKTTKPDTSFATETGHFHLLPTTRSILVGREKARIVKNGPALFGIKHVRRFAGSKPRVFGGT